jgi:hypothetical protein
MGDNNYSGINAMKYIGISFKNLQFYFEGWKNVNKKFVPVSLPPVFNIWM